MTYRDAYTLLALQLETIYEPQESATIARYLIEDLFGKTFWSEDILSPDHNELLNSSIERLLTHEPWQYVGGKADFYGLQFNVSNAVLIPRPETEELVHLTINVIKSNGLSSVLDIGTGPGIIPITIAKKCSLKHVFGLDVCRKALEIAQSNNQYHHTNVTFLENNILEEANWSQLPKVDIVISNPPYITDVEKGLMSKNVLDFEPHIALFVNDNPLEFYVAISRFVMSTQALGCKLMVEVNEHYGHEVAQLFIDEGLHSVQLLQDLQGKDRMVSCVK